jgi:hypothetical protein
MNNPLIELDYAGVLSTLQELLGQHVTVLIAGADALLTGVPQESAARFRGLLRRTQASRQIGGAYEDDESVFLVGGDVEDEDLGSWFALMPESFVGAHRNDDDRSLTVVCGQIATIITWASEE